MHGNIFGGSNGLRSEKRNEKIAIVDALLFFTRFIQSLSFSLNSSLKIRIDKQGQGPTFMNASESIEMIYLNRDSTKIIWVFLFSISSNSYYSGYRLNYV